MRCESCNGTGCLDAAADRDVLHPAMRGPHGEPLIPCPACDHGEIALGSDSGAAGGDSHGNANTYTDTCPECRCGSHLRCIVGNRWTCSCVCRRRSKDARAATTGSGDSGPTRTVESAQPSRNARGDAS